MSQPTSPATPKQSYAAAVAQQTTAAVVSNSGVYTRAMEKKMTVNEAAASLRATKVPTKGRTYTVSSIMAAASSIIARTSPSNTKVATPTKAIKVPKPSCEASVLTVGASTMEEQMQEMRRMLEQILKDNEEKNKKIEDLQREVVSLSKQKLDETTTTITPEDGDDNKTASTEIVKAQAVACNESQLKVLIANVVRGQLTGNPSGGTRYTKPYSKLFKLTRFTEYYNQLHINSIP